MIDRMRVKTIYGVDFSGAAEAGRNAWIARCAPIESGKRLRVEHLAALETHAGESKRDVALRWLVGAIQTSREALWGIDFPFGLPIELGWSNWPAQLAAIGAWTDSANAFGRHCCALAMKAVGKLHTRRDTDAETRTPFDCYHYRIIYQTFHGMRDVLAPLREDASTCVLPFDVESLQRASRIVVEACPGSTLRRLKLPHNRYKQSKPGRVAAKYVRVRETILGGLESFIELGAAERKRILRNPGGDALDAVIAAVGTWSAYRSLDADAMKKHPRYTREGFVFC